MAKIYDNLDEMICENIKPEMYIHIASTLARPNAAVNAIVRVFQDKDPKFTFSATAMVGNLHVIGLSRIARKVIAAFCGDNCLKARPNRLYKQMLKEGKPFAIEQCTTLGVIQRLMGGAQNLPYVLTNSMIDSDLLEAASEYTYVVDNPENPQDKITLMKSLYPDITLVHGICADKNGNVVMSGPLGESVWGCLAARKGVLVTVEKIVEEDVIKKYQDRVVIPGDRVIGISEVPYGAHPQGMLINGVIDQPDYYDDYDFFEEVRNATKTEELKEAFFNKWINLPNGQREYQQLIEKKRLLKITQKNLYVNFEEPNGELTEREILIIMAARAIIDNVEKKHYKTILAGIGFAHIAAWIAYKVLKEKGIHVRVMSELGFYGMDPYFGDVYLFSQRHSNGCEKWSNVVEILGAEVGNQNTCLGVLGAAEVDFNGNINSTIIDESDFFIGSGGANDIASVTDSLVIVMPDKQRMVEKVNFITSPGKNIKEIITTFGRFSRKNQNEKFELTTWNSLNENDFPDQMINDKTSWNCGIATDLQDEVKITEQERKLVWEMDPKGVFR